jgi:hypothetical protein
MSINPEVDRGLVDCDLGSEASARLAIKAKSPPKIPTVLFGGLPFLLSIQ